ncbi:hypothetical protein MBLNU457_7368t1 [Dothideomycetes sp. NU457]
MDSFSRKESVDDYTTSRSDSAISLDGSNCFSIGKKQCNDDQSAQRALQKMQRRCDASAQSIHRQALERSWLEDFHDDIYIPTSGLGAFLRRPDGTYSSTTQDHTIHDAVDVLQPHVALTFSNNDVSLLLDSLSFDQRIITVHGDFTIAVRDSVDDITRPDFSIPANVSHCVCRKEHFVLIWSTSVSLLFQEADMLERFLGFKTRRYLTPHEPRFTSNPFERAFELDLPEITLSQPTEQTAATARPLVDVQPSKRFGAEQSHHIEPIYFSPVDYGNEPTNRTSIDYTPTSSSRRLSWNRFQSFGRRISLVNALSVS